MAVVISDGREGVSQFCVTEGYWPVFKNTEGREYTDCGYVESLTSAKAGHPEAVRFVRAIQIDTGV